MTLVPLKWQTLRCSDYNRCKKPIFTKVYESLYVFKNLNYFSTNERRHIFDVWLFDSTNENGVEKKTTSELTEKMERHKWRKHYERKVTLKTQLTDYNFKLES